MAQFVKVDAMIEFVLMFDRGSLSIIFRDIDVILCNKESLLRLSLEVRV